MNWRDATPPMLVEKAREIIARDPGFIYRADTYNGDAAYLHKDEDNEPRIPGCIWGHVFVEIGVPIEDIELWEGCTVSKVVQELWYYTEAEEYDLEIRWMETLQSEQDAGKYEWSRCGAVADSFFPLNV